MVGGEAAPIRVLLVDDHKSVLWGLEKLIDSARPSMEVIGKATRCAEALAAIEKNRPDVVLLDVFLEEDNGLDLLDALRGRRGLNVLILTGFHDAEMLERAMLGGARGAVYKSESAENILKAIAHVHNGEFWLPRACTANLFASALAANKGGEKNGHAFACASLTAAERRIIAAVVEHKGAPSKVIADALHISSNTLRNHLASTYSKLGVHTRLDLYLYAKQHGLDKVATRVA
jgi:two-component system, NarL family, nitrate/nitrite response regulator NarL